MKVFRKIKLVDNLYALTFESGIFKEGLDTYPVNVLTLYKFERVKDLWKPLSSY
jgi:hypothetical protein